MRFAAFLVLGACLLLACGGCKPANPKQVAKFYGTADAKIAAERAILKALKSPSTAKLSIVAKQKGSKSFTAEGTVTAQNSFSAELTQPVFATLYRESDEGASGMQVGTITIDGKSVFSDADVVAKIKFDMGMK